MAFGHAEEAIISDHEANFEVAKASIRDHLLGFFSQLELAQQYTIAIGRGNKDGSPIIEVRLSGLPEAITDAFPVSYMGFPVNYKKIGVISTLR